MISSRKIYSSLKRTIGKAIDSFVESNAVKAFGKKFPRSYRFLSDRFSLDAFTGLPLTFILLAFLINIFILSNIVEAFVNSTGIITLDEAFTRLMFRLRQDGLIHVFFLFSKLGSFYGVVFVLVISSICMWIRNKKVFILPMLISTEGSNLVMSTAKKYFHRARPEQFWYYQEADFSFPSGHATISIAFYGVLFYTLIRTRKTNTSKLYWLIAGIVFISLLGFSRLYLCVHYLSDVIAGYSLGILWLLVAVSITEWIFHRRRKKALKPDITL